jgi:hypothetical protein
MLMDMWKSLNILSKNSTKMLPQVKRKLIGWILPRILIQEEMDLLAPQHTIKFLSLWCLQYFFALHIWLLQNPNTLQNNVSNVDLILFYGSKTHTYIYIVKLQYNKDIWKWRETQQQCIQFWAFSPSCMDSFNMCSMAQATTLVW